MDNSRVDKRHHGGHDWSDDDYTASVHSRCSNGTEGGKAPRFSYALQRGAYGLSKDCFEGGH